MKRSLRAIGPANRTVAGLLAAVWLTGGFIVLFLALSRHQWLGIVLGPLAIGYGLLWVRVAQTGRLLGDLVRRR